MLKQLILLWLMIVNINLNGSAMRFWIDVEFEPFRCLCKDVSDEGVATVFRDPDKLKLFAAVDRLLGVVPGRKLDHECMCGRNKQDIIEAKYDIGEGNFYSIWAPWVVVGIRDAIYGDLDKSYRSDIDKNRELIRNNGFGFEERYNYLKDKSFEFTALDGEVLPKMNLTSSERCIMFAAWRQYQSPEAREERVARTRRM